MAAGVGVAPGLGCAWDRYIFLLVCASVLARTASVLREGYEDPRAARETARACALPHLRDPLLRCRRTESGGTAVDSDLCGGCVLWWALRTGMDVDLAQESQHPQ